MNGSPVQSMVITGTTLSKEDSKATIEKLIVEVNKKANSYEALMDTNKRETVQWQEDFLELQSTLRKKKNRVKELNKEVEILKTQNEDLSERLYKLTLGSEEVKSDERMLNALEQAKKEIADQYEIQLIKVTKENDNAKKEYERLENDYNFTMSELEQVMHNYNKKISNASKELDDKNTELKRLKAQLAGETLEESHEIPKSILLNNEETKEEPKFDLSSLFTQENKIQFEETNRLMADFSNRIYNNITAEEKKVNNELIKDSISAGSLYAEVALYLLSQALGDSYKVFLSDRIASADHELSMHLIGSGAYASCCWKFSFDFGDKFFDEFPSNTEFTEFLRREISLYLGCAESNVVIEQSEEEPITFYLKKPTTKQLELTLSSDFLEHMKKSTKNSMKTIEITPYLSALKLSTDQMDVEGDKDYKGYLVGKSRRGGFDYFYPVGWRGFGIKIKDKYESNKWLQCITQEYPEWAAAYHGISPPIDLSKMKEHGLKVDGSRQFYSEAIDTLTGEKCGNGIYLTPHIEVAAKDCQPVSMKIDGKKTRFLVVLQCRVNSKAMKVPEKDSTLPSHAGDQEWKNDYWIVNSANDIRSCRILLKQVS